MTTIRPATQSDVQVVCSLARSFATSFVLDEAAFRRSCMELLASSQAHLLVAEVQGQVRGYLLGFEHATFYANGRVAWVEEVAVDADFRRRGLGKLLMQEFEEWARQRDCRLVALATRRAAAFYETLGYEESAAYYRKNL